MKYTVSLINLLIVMVFLSACAKQKVVVDNSPKNPTAVIKAKGTLNGVMFPDSTFKQVSYTRKDRRAIFNDREFDAWMSRQFMGDTDNKEIFRLDKNLRWNLFDLKKEKKYIECPLGGCSISSLIEFDKMRDTSEENTFDYEPGENYSAESDAEMCSTKITKNSFKVKATGKQRTISGYSTKEYRADWIVEYKDSKGRKDTNKLIMVFWNTEPNRNMKKVWAINEKATQAYRRKVNNETNSLSRLIPDDIFVSLSAFSGDTAKSNKKWKNSISREMAKAKGYPMSIKVEWYLDRKACIEKTAEVKKDKGFDWSNPLGSIKDSASDMVGGSVKKMFLPKPNEPVFRYVYQVTDVEVVPVHDSVFEIPSGFTLVTRE